MNAEVDDPDVYHQDFTTASSWEEFVDHIEKTIIDWKLNQPRARQPLHSRYLEGEWETKTVEIDFEDEKFTLSWWNLKENVNVYLDDEESEKVAAPLPQALADMMSISGDFVTVSSCPKIAQLYGLREFLLLKCAKRHTISSETKAKILLSSITMALNSTACEVPGFVQLLEDWQHFYLGSSISKAISADFEMVHLERTPPHCKYLTGLLDTFKSKISCGQQLPSINIAVKLTFSLRMLKPMEYLNIVQDRKGSESSSLMNLPFGVASDPISKLHLFTTWPQLTDQMVVDSPSYSDLEPMQAHLWAVQIEPSENQSPTPLSQCLFALCKLSTEPLKPFTVDCAKNTKLSESLDVLTESKVPSISAVVGRVRTRAGYASGSTHKKKQGSIPDSRLREYLYFLFPDADKDAPEPYKPFDSSANPKQFPCNIDHVKSAPPESLVWRLALLLPLVYARDGAAAAAYLWYEFTEEMRFRWDMDIPIPGVKPGFADLKTCVLHQRLQMLNVCIERKKKKKEKRDDGDEAGPSGCIKASSDSDDDCYDSAEDVDMEVEEALAGEPSKPSKPSKPQVQHSLWNQPEGRKCKCRDLLLLQTGEPLYIPYTQELVPKTEDDFDEVPIDVDVAAATEAKSKSAKAHAYSGSVTLSDMEAFKAANPGGTLEDFVRWYSPRDWVEDPWETIDGQTTFQDVDEQMAAGTWGGKDQWGQPRGQLSARMRLPDNVWVQLWSVARPVPAKRQPRLFDETRAAEGVLSRLEGLSARQVALDLLPVLAHACAERALAEARADGLLHRVAGVRAAAHRLRQQTRNALQDPEQAVELYQKLVAEVQEVERRVSAARLLRDKLCPELVGAELGPGEDGSAGSVAVLALPEAEPDEETKLVLFLSKLLDGEEVAVPGGARGQVGANIKAMFAEAQKMAQLLPASGPEPGRSGRPEWSAASPMPSSSAFPAADVKEVVMRVVAPRPGPASKPCPQRLYALHRKDEFRLAGCFARDVAFF